METDQTAMLIIEEGAAEESAELVRRRPELPVHKQP